MDLASVFKAYDVRGVYPEQIDEVVAHRIGGAFAEFTGAQTVVVGRDMRVSSEPLSRAFIEGVLGRGVNVVDIGLVSTDTLYFASGRHSMPGAMFTASHNPGQYNGIKMCLKGAAPIGEETGLKDILRLAEAGFGESPGVGAVAERDVMDDFVEHVLKFVDSSRFRPLKVVVDAANGMGGKLVPPVFEHLPVELVDLYFDLDGTFPNHPADPIQIENLADLRKAVLQHEADLGMAFDGDADRVFLVDNKAEPVSGSLTTALVASRVLRRSAGAQVVHNLICSRVVPETVREGGGVPVRTRVGHSFIKQVMAETGAIFGGEHSGHYYFRDNFRADSGIIAALLVLEELSEQAAPMSEVLAPFKRYWNSGERNTAVKDLSAKMEQIAKVHSSGVIDLTDGLTVDYPDWWFNVRPSNTEPLLRLNVEDRDPSHGHEMTEGLLTLIRS